MESPDSSSKKTKKKKKSIRHKRSQSLSVSTFIVPAVTANEDDEPPSEKPEKSAEKKERTPSSERKKRSMSVSLLPSLNESKSLQDIKQQVQARESAAMPPDGPAPAGVRGFNRIKVRMTLQVEHISGLPKKCKGRPVYVSWKAMAPDGKTKVASGKTQKKTCSRDGSVTWDKEEATILCNTTLMQNQHPPFEFEDRNLMFSIVRDGVGPDTPVLSRAVSSSSDIDVSSALLESSSEDGSSSDAAPQATEAVVGKKTLGKALVNIGKFGANYFHETVTLSVVGRRSSMELRVRVSNLWEMVNDEPVGRNFTGESGGGVSVVDKEIGIAPRSISKSKKSKEKLKRSQSTDIRDVEAGSDVLTALKAKYEAQISQLKHEMEEKDAQHSDVLCTLQSLLEERSFKLRDLQKELKEEKERSASSALALQIKQLEETVRQQKVHIEKQKTVMSGMEVELRSARKRLASSAVEDDASHDAGDSKKRRRKKKRKQKKSKDPATETDTGDDEGDDDDDDDEGARELDSKEAALQVSINDLRESLQIAKQALGEREKEVASLRERVAEGTADELRVRINQLEQAKDVLVHQRQSATLLAGKKNKELTALEAEFALQKDIILDTRKRLESREQELAAALQQATARDDELRKLRKKMKAKGMALDESVTETTALRQMVEDLRSRLQEEAKSMNQPPDFPAPMPPSFDAAPDAKPEELRARAVREIVDTESTYLHQLQTLVWGFKKALRENARSKQAVLSAIEIDALFANVEEVYAFNKRLLNDLIKVTGDPTGSIGQLFLHSAPEMSVYGKYINNYDRAVSRLMELMKSKAFVKVLEETKDQSGRLVGANMGQYLITPVQRLPRYEMLLGQLVKYTPEDHYDRAELEEARVAVKRVVDQLNESKREFERVEALNSVNDRLFGKPSGFTVVVPGRCLLHEGVLAVQLTKWAPKKNRHAFLFSDCLVLAKSKPQGPGNKRKFIRVLSLDMRVENNTEEKNGFRVTPVEGASEDKGTEVVESWFASSPQEKDQWLTALLDAKRALLLAREQEEERSRQRTEQAAAEKTASGEVADAVPESTESSSKDAAGNTSIAALRWELLQLRDGVSKRRKVGMLLQERLIQNGLDPTADGASFDTPSEALDVELGRIVARRRRKNKHKRSRSAAARTGEGIVPSEENLSGESDEVIELDSEEESTPEAIDLDAFDWSSLSPEEIEEFESVITRQKRALTGVSYSMGVAIQAMKGRLEERGVVVSEQEIAAAEAASVVADDGAPQAVPHESSTEDIPDATGASRATSTTVPFESFNDADGDLVLSVQIDGAQHEYYPTLASTGEDGKPPPVTTVSELVAFLAAENPAKFAELQGIGEDGTELPSDAAVSSVRSLKITERVKPRMSLRMSTFTVASMSGPGDTDVVVSTDGDDGRSPVAIEGTRAAIGETAASGEGETAPIAEPGTSTTKRRPALTATMSRPVSVVSSADAGAAQSDDMEVLQDAATAEHADGSAAGAVSVQSPAVQSVPVRIFQDDMNDTVIAVGPSSSCYEYYPSLSDADNITTVAGLGWYLAREDANTFKSFVARSSTGVLAATAPVTKVRFLDGLAWPPKKALYFGSSQSSTEVQAAIAAGVQEGEEAAADAKETEGEGESFATEADASANEAEGAEGEADSERPSAAQQFLESLPPDEVEEPDTEEIGSSLASIFHEIMQLKEVQRCKEEQSARAMAEAEAAALHEERQQFERSMDEIAELEEQLKKQRQLITEQEKQLQENRDRLGAETKALEEQRLALTEEKRKMVEQMARLETANAQLSSLADHAKTSLEEQRQADTDRILSLEVQLEESRRALSLAEEIKKVREDADTEVESTGKATASFLEERLRTATVELVDVRQQLHAARGELEGLKRVNEIQREALLGETGSSQLLEEKTLELGALQQQYDVLQGKLEQIERAAEQKAIEEAEIRGRTEEEEIDAAKAEMVALQEAVAEQQRSILQWEQRTAEARERAAQLEEEIEQWEEKVENSNEELQRVRDAAQKSDLIASEAELQVQEQRSELACLQALVEEKDEANAQATERCEDLARKLEAMEQDRAFTSLLFENIYSVRCGPKTSEFDLEAHPTVAAASIHLCEFVKSAHTPESEQRTISTIAEICFALRASVERCEKDNQKLIFWLSVVAGLLHRLQMEDCIPFVNDVLVTGAIKRSPAEEALSQPTTWEECEAFVEELLNEILDSVARNNRIVIERHVPLLFHSFAPGATARCVLLLDLCSSSLTVSRESAEVPTSPVLRDLDAMMEWLTAYHVFPALVAQIVSRAFYSINALFFNQLVGSPQLCCSLVAYGDELRSVVPFSFKIKIALSNIQGWIAEACSSGQHSRAFIGVESKLSHINEAANALVILPNATDFSMDHMATFPTLNLAQMKHIIDSYTPCEEAPEPIPKAVLQVIEDYSAVKRSLGRMAILLDPDTLPPSVYGATT